VAATRVLLGVHWLTDVVAGLVLGWTWFAMVSVAFGGRLLRLGEPLEAAERVIFVSERAEAPSAEGPPAPACVDDTPTSSR
jgi:undecaprenyl-diphosphatase